MVRELAENYNNWHNIIIGKEVYNEVCRTGSKTQDIRGYNREARIEAHDY
jgi:hypothetical protein